MTWIFGSFLVTLCALTSCHVVISKQGNGSGSGQGRQVQQEGDHVITTWSDLDRGRELGVKPGNAANQRVRLSLMIWFAWGCKCWYPLVPRRRYGTRRSPLSEYMSLKLTTNCGSFSRIKWEIYYEKCLVCSLSLVMFLVGSMRLYNNDWIRQNKFFKVITITK